MNCQFVDSVMLPLPAFPALFGKSSSQSISQAELPHVTALHAQKRGATRAEFAFKEGEKAVSFKNAVTVSDISPHHRWAK